MSDDCACDGCGGLGRRPRRAFCPDGWLYLEAVPENGDPEGILIMMACSKECALKLWVPNESGTFTLTATDSADPDFPQVKVTAATLEAGFDLWQKGRGYMGTFENMLAAKAAWLEKQS